MHFSTLWLMFWGNFQLNMFSRVLTLESRYEFLMLLFKELGYQKHNFFQGAMTYKFMCAWAVRNASNLQIYSSLAGFKWGRFMLFSGLGYKSSFYKKFRVMFSYVADSHWILYKFLPFSLVGPHRSSNFVLFSFYKGAFARDYNFFSSLSRQQVYKMKGFMDASVRGRFLFVSSMKMRNIKTKLSKKQKLL